MTPPKTLLILILGWYLHLNSKYIYTRVILFILAEVLLCVAMGKLGTLLNMPVNAMDKQLFLFVDLGSLWWETCRHRSFHNR